MMTVLCIIIKHIRNTSLFIHKIIVFVLESDRITLVFFHSPFVTDNILSLKKYNVPVLLFRNGQVTISVS